MVDQAENFEPTAKELESPGTSTLQRVAAMQMLQGRMAERQERLFGKMSDLCEAMYGDRRGTAPGLIERVRNVEEFMTTRRWWERTVAAALVTAIIAGLLAVNQFVIAEQAKAAVVRQKYNKEVIP